VDKQQQIRRVVSIFPLAHPTVLFTRKDNDGIRVFRLEKGLCYAFLAVMALVRKPDVWRTRYGHDHDQSRALDGHCVLQYPTLAMAEL
jgi:hypothetical protein